MMDYWLLAVLVLKCFTNYKMSPKAKKFSNSLITKIIKRPDFYEDQNYRKIPGNDHMLLGENCR